MQYIHTYIHEKFQPSQFNRADCPTMMYKTYSCFLIHLLLVILKVITSSYSLSDGEGTELYEPKYAVVNATTRRNYCLKRERHAFHDCMNCLSTIMQMKLVRQSIAHSGERGTIQRGTSDDRKDITVWYLNEIYEKIRSKYSRPLQICLMGEWSEQIVRATALINPHSQITYFATANTQGNILKGYFALKEFLEVELHSSLVIKSSEIMETNQWECLQECDAIHLRDYAGSESSGATARESGLLQDISVRNLRETVDAMHHSNEKLETLPIIFETGVSETRNISKKVLTDRLSGKISHLHLSHHSLLCSCTITIIVAV